MSATQLSEELEVSTRTIFRDIESLSGAGVPVYAVRGPKGGFGLLEGYTTELTHPREWNAPLSEARRRVGARVLISAEGRRLVALLREPKGLRARPLSEEKRKRPGWVEASLPIDSIESAMLQLLRLGSEVEILDPPVLRSRMAAEAARMAALYEA